MNMSTETPWTLKVPKAMVENLKKGRYAVRMDQSDPYTFILVARPTFGRFKGCLTIKTQHGERYLEAVVLHPSGFVHISNRNVEMPLFLACADPMTAAIAYGRELGCCSSCGRKLTDERSRYYSIGPECEKSWPEIIASVDEESGPYFPGVI